MYSYFNYFIKNGLYKETSKIEVKKIKILNYCILVGFINTFFFILLEACLNRLNIDNFFSYIFQIITFTLVFLFQKKKKYFTARLLFLILGFTLVFYYNNYAYRGFYGEYLFLFLPITSLLFFDNNWYCFSILIICIISFYIPNLYFNIYPEKYFGYLNGLFLFIGSFVLVYYFKYENKKNEEKLQKNKQELELAYLELEESKKNEYADLKLKSLRAQMNPHFMFNALNSIQDLILKQDTDASYDYIVMFAQLIRDTLNYSNQDFISIEEELEFLKIYLELEKLRIGNEFNYTIDYKENESIEVPSLLIQPFIENALVHGLIHKTGKKELHIDFKLTKKALECTITDNGIGRQKAELIVKRQGNNHKSFALDAIEKRLEVFYKKYYEKVGYNIIDLYENENAIGTKVILTIPYKMRF